jgi:hypothetical protein
VGAPKQRDPEPTEPTAGSGPDSGGTGDAATVAPPPAKRGWLTKRVLIIIAVVVAAILGVGAVTALVAYDKATELDRSTPTIAVQQFVYAAFVNRNENRTTLFICSGSHVPETVASVLTGLDPSVKIALGRMSEKSRAGDSAVVSAELELSSGGFTDVQNWEFDTADQNGWRVCGARRVS